ncbi:MAG: cell division protein FtsX [Flavobacteriaceae bacterium]
MSKSFEKYQNRRLKSSYFSVVLSMTIVLFVIGALGTLLAKSSSIGNYFKEQMPVAIFIKDEVSQDKINRFVQSLQEEQFTNRVTFISKEDAAADFSAELGEDFLSFLGSNPLKNSVDLYLKADFVNIVSMDLIEKDLLSNAYVFEVTYDKPLVSLMNENLKKMSKYILIVCAFFTVVSVILINSSLRLSVYSKRFTIKTMQMVGATKSFIRRPFIWTNVKLGLIAALLASIGLGTVLYYLDQNFPDLGLIADKELLVFVGAGVFLTAILISSFSTFIATTRFLNLRTEQLYN